MVVTNEFVAILTGREENKNSTPLVEWKTVQKTAEKCHVPGYELVKAVSYLQEIGELVYCAGKENQVEREP